MTWGLAIAVWFASTGCTRPDLPAPVVERVERPFAYNGDAELVTIHGRHFYPVVAIDAVRGGADVDRSWAAWLVGPKGGIELERPLVGVGMRDDTELVATVDAGKPPGVYDVVVESPTGRRGRLAGGFTVTDTRAEALSLSAVDGVVHPITEAAAVRIQVVDLGGEVVPIPFEVSIGAKLAGEVDVSVDPGTLRPSESTPDGNGVTGTLVDGEAVVYVSSPSPGPVTVLATPREPEIEVAPATLDLQFDPGDDLSVAIRLPVPADPIPAFEAGVPIDLEVQLIDQFGNPVDYPLPNVVLATQCSLGIARVDLDGPEPTTAQITPTRVTTENCPLDKVYVFTGPSGSSPLFTVLPGPPTDFDVGLVGGVVRAGETGTFTVIPKDDHGNDTFFDGTLAFSLSTGAVFDPICGVGSFPEHLQCAGQLTVAARSQVLTVTGQGAQTEAVGVSDPFDVVADDVPMAIEVQVLPAGPVPAGEPFVVEVTTRDAWGNVIDPSVLAADPVVITDDQDEISCAEDGTTLLGALSLSCTLYTARTGAAVTAERPLAGLSVQSAAFDVVNGELAVVEVTGPTQVVAGAVATFDLVGEDAFGNRYQIQADPVVALADDSGTLSVGTATLGANGTTSVGGFFTRAGPTVVRVSQDGVELGASNVVQVLPAATTALAVRPAAPFAWVGEPLEVRVEAVDAFGNRTTWAGSATLSSRTTAAPDVPVTLTGGAGTGDFVWDAPSFGEVLEGAAGTLSGEVAVPVSTRCDGLVAAIDFGGFPDAVACTDPLDGTATLTADLSGSLRGAAPLVGYAVGPVGGTVTTSASPVLDVTLPGTGHHALRALVHDEDGCGAEVAASGWAGPDDGRPVGPIALSTTAVAPDVNDTLTIDVTGVTDCARDPAAYAEIEVRTTGGALTATPTGHGLFLELDGAGDAAVDLVMDGGLAQADLEVHATVEGGSAAGMLPLDVIGDNVWPTVLAQEPSGITAGTVSEVRLTFSEPLDPALVAAAAFAVSGPEAVTVTPTLLPGGVEVLLTLSAPVDASAGAYTVLAPRTLRDLAGNRLMGDWANRATDYLGWFGSAGAVPSSATCVATVPPELVLRPDGDPGTGPESDVVSLTVTAGAAPAWWVIEVRDALDAVVWHTRTVPAGVPDTLVWAARDRRGIVVPNGVYRMSVAPEDGFGNRGVGCEVALTVDNPLGTP